METLSLSYEDWVRKELKEGGRVLDAGCGGGEFGVVKEILETPLDLVGVDIDKDSLHGNEKYNHLVCGSVEQLPLKDDLFNLIVSRFVFEHLETPTMAFDEMFRVLKQGGSIIILTQNLWNPLMFLSYLLPLSIRRWITQKVFRSEKDEGRYETYYHCNNRRGFKRLEKRQGGIKMASFQRYNATTLHLWKNPLLKSLFFIVEKLLALEILSLFRGSLIVKYKKSGSSPGS
jgi:ubiquinone/menaquinone biosynthesis C-methylase UbiE